MKMPMVLRWFAHEMDESWGMLDDDSKAGCFIFWVVAALADIFALIFCNNQWTRELGYGWVQGLFNWSMFFFWFTTLPFVTLCGYALVKAVIYIVKSAIKSYSEYKRDHE